MQFRGKKITSQADQKSASSSTKYLSSKVRNTHMTARSMQSTSLAGSSAYNLNTTANASQKGNSSSSVSIEQIKALEQKIASLNEQIASIMHRSVET